MSNVLEEYIRPIQDGDEKLPEFSHSRLETFETCPYRFNLRYNQEKIPTDSTLALSFGSICHKVLEIKGQMILNGEPIDYDKLYEILNIGYPEENLRGVNELKRIYWETWGIVDSEGNDYNTKFTNVKKVIESEMEDSDWQVYKTEEPFEFVYRDRARFRGSIDRIDKRGDELRIIDYKTNKKPFDDRYIKTSQQMGLYNLALIIKYGQLATENMYRFICIDQQQYAMSLGWEKRLISKLDKVFAQIDECYNTELWKVKPSPLCRWCSYSKTNPDAKQYKNDCEFHSLWTENNKTFEVNKEWNPELQAKSRKVFDW